MIFLRFILVQIYIFLMKMTNPEIENRCSSANLL